MAVNYEWLEIKLQFPMMAATCQVLFTFLKVNINLSLQLPKKNIFLERGGGERERGK